MSDRKDLFAFTFRNYGTWRRPDVYLVLGPWAVRLMSPYYGGTFGNGSRWSSGWHRWKDDPSYGD